MPSEHKSSDLVLRCMVGGLFRAGVLDGKGAMMPYQAGDKVRILRGRYAGQVMTVRECTDDEVFLAELPSRESMSKLNVELVETGHG